MDVRLAGSFLPLLFLVWLLAARLTHQISATVNMSVKLDLDLQHLLLQTGSSSTAGKVKCLNTPRNNGEEQNEGCVEMKKDFVQLFFTNVNTSNTVTYTCRMENRKNVSENRYPEKKKDGQRQKPTSTHGRGEKGKRKGGERGTVSPPEELDITMKWGFKIRSENLSVSVKQYKPAGPEVGNQTNTTALGENCTNLTSPDMRAANTGICTCSVFITGINWTDTGNGMQGTVPNYCPGISHTNNVEHIWIGFKFPLCIIFSVAGATLLYMPIIVLLLWQHRRHRQGELASRQVAEGTQLSTAASVTGTEDLTYANIKFEKKGTKPASSDVVYSEIKPPQQKQSGEGVGAAETEVDVSPKGEGK